MLFFCILHNFNAKNVTLSQIEQPTKTNKNAPRINLEIAKLSLSETQLGILFSVFYKITPHHRGLPKKPGALHRPSVAALSVSAFPIKSSASKKLRAVSYRKAQSKQSGTVFMLVRGVRIIGATVSRHFL